MRQGGFCTCGIQTGLEWTPLKVSANVQRAASSGEDCISAMPCASGCIPNITIEVFLKSKVYEKSANNLAVKESQMKDKRKMMI